MYFSLFHSAYYQTHPLSALQPKIEIHYRTFNPSTRNFQSLLAKLVDSLSPKVVLKMLTIALSRLALLRASTSRKRYVQYVHPRTEYFYPTTSPTSLIQRQSFFPNSGTSLTAFRHNSWVCRADKWNLNLSFTKRYLTDRQEFSVYFNEDEVVYRFKVSAAENLSLDAVWHTVSRWLKHRGAHEWTEENLAFVRKAVARAVSMTSLQPYKDHTEYAAGGGVCDGALREKRRKP